jgi:hypothetical protein
MLQNTVFKNNLETLDILLLQMPTCNQPEYFPYKRVLNTLL